VEKGTDVSTKSNTIRIEWPTHKKKAAQAKARKLRWKKKGAPTWHTPK
jgi:hypothetical protein